MPTFLLKKSTLQHLRIPFSVFLMPFFCFAASLSSNPDLPGFVLSFFIIHLFFNPGSNGFNSFYDKDEESIGGLEKPPPVDIELLYTSLAFHAIAQLLAFWVSLTFALMLLLIGLASSAYSHPAIRLKKYPVGGLLTVVFFQGAWTFLMAVLAINQFRFEQLMEAQWLYPAGICSLLLLGSYPMTQVYQHGEDGRRGDRTFSLILGVRGTFYWTSAVFALGTSALVLYLWSYVSLTAAFLLPVFMLPTLAFFGYWFLQVLKDPKAADFKRTMWLNKISSLSFIAYFILLYFLK